MPWSLRREDGSGFKADWAKRAALFWWPLRCPRYDAATYPETVVNDGEAQQREVDEHAFAHAQLSPPAQLFLASFLALFLELLLIRWVPSLVRAVAYYGNLMLLSSFLGLGCGALLAERGARLDRWFPVALLALVVATTALAGIRFQQGGEELRFMFEPGVRTTVLPLLLLFGLNVAVFVPLGERIGTVFRQLPPLTAYAWDLGGALAGTCLFGFFSYTWFSPVVGTVLALAGWAVGIRERSALALGVPAGVLAILVMIVGVDPHAIWSPYNLISIRQTDATAGAEFPDAPPPDLATRLDPPRYIVQVNGDFYMYNLTLNASRYSQVPKMVASLAAQYAIPHRVRPGAQDVLVVGSGGGCDVESALLNGALRVDAVEIDPAVIRMGLDYNASQAYRDPRVTVHENDARAFLHGTDRKFDMVVFGFLDSQGLFSQMSSIRIDGFVFTRESFRDAFDRLRSGGLLSVSFFAANQDWLVDRLRGMMRSATGAEPLAYARPSGQVVLLAGRDFVPVGPERLGVFERTALKPLSTPEAVDDWPYLYLRSRTIPADYLVNIGALLGLSVVIVRLASPGRRRGVDRHFFFLGAGFLLLETKSITTVSLWFGATWFVSTVVIAGVLGMVLAANFVAARRPAFSPRLYVPLLASVAFLYAFPMDAAAGWPFAARLAFSLVVIPLPIFFAGLIFSANFRAAPDPAYAFGSNLLGAMLGGFVEYAGMIVGTRALLLGVIAFYVFSALARPRSASSA